MLLSAHRSQSSRGAPRSPPNPLPALTSQSLRRNSTCFHRRCASRASSTRTVHGWPSRTAVSCPTSSARRGLISPHFPTLWLRLRLLPSHPHPPVAPPPRLTRRSFPGFETTQTKTNTFHLSPPLQAIRNEPITIHGDGSQTRSFQYVSDLVAGLMRLMDNDEHTGPFNIGNPGAREPRGAAAEAWSFFACAAVPGCMQRVFMCAYDG